MSLDKSILHGKEHREPYIKAKAIAQSCRNHKSCPWCLRNRKHSERRAELAAKDREHE